MKKTYLFISLALSFVLIAASGGVGEDQNKDRSGSPDGDNVCSMCHSAGAFSADITLSVVDAGGSEVMSYIPGETYFLNYTVTGDGASVYGFQSTALTADNENAGAFANPGTQVQLETVDNENVTNRAVVEHSSESSTGVFNAEWVAPAAGTGDVSFYFSGVAANANGMASGDGYAGNEFLLVEDTDFSVEEAELSSVEFNWNNESLLISSQAQSSLDKIEIYDLTGKQIYSSANASLPIKLDAHELAKGLNVIQVVNGSDIQTHKVLN